MFDIKSILTCLHVVHKCLFFMIYLMICLSCAYPSLTSICHNYSSFSPCIEWTSAPLLPIVEFIKNYSFHHADNIFGVLSNIEEIQFDVAYSGLHICLPREYAISQRR